jgi:hypothetical protein
MIDYDRSDRPGRYALAMRAGMSVLLALSACSSLPPAPRAILDEKTGVTTTVVAAPMSFARVHNDVGASARDYVTLVAVERDAAGHYTDLLLLYRWSVMVRGDMPESPTSVGPVLIRADAQEIPLQPLDQVPVNLSPREQFFEPYDIGVAVAAYAVDFKTLRSIAASHELHLSLSQDVPDEPFTLWRDGRSALDQFVKQLNGL